MRIRNHPKRLVTSPRGVVAATLVATLALVAGCSDDSNASPSESTTGTLPRSTSTLPTTTTTTMLAPDGSDGPGSDSLAGLWLATAEGITDEDGTVYAKPDADETLREPVDDGFGGVFYSRCAGDAVTCSVEHVLRRGTEPQVIGDADRLFAVGTYQGRQVLITSWTDPSLVPSFEGNVSGLVARLLDTTNGDVLGPYAWFGWESGPFAADVENDTFVACFGEGEACGFSKFADPALPSGEVAGTEFSTVMSLALDMEATKLTWLEMAPMTGSLHVHIADLGSGAPPATEELRTEDEAPADDAVTDGTWVAIRTGTTVEMRSLGENEAEGEREVPDDVTGMAIRSLGSAGSSNGML